MVDSCNRVVLRGWQAACAFVCVWEEELGVSSFAGFCSNPSVVPPCPGMAGGWIPPPPCQRLLAGLLESWIPPISSQTEEIVGWTSPACCKHEEEIDYIPTIIFIWTRQSLAARTTFHKLLRLLMVSLDQVQSSTVLISLSLSLSLSLSYVNPFGEK